MFKGQSHEMWEFGYDPRIGEVKEFHEGYPENITVLGFEWLQRKFQIESLV